MPKKKKTIRLTKTEAYAMQMERPKKKKLTFFLVGLFLVAVLGGLLWFFQNLWLPYWLPADEETGIPIETASSGEEPVPPSTSAPIQAPSAVTVPLDFLSAAAWDHPKFHQGVRLFNQSLDRYRTYLKPPRNPELLAQAAEGTRQAGRTFQSLKPVEPSDEPLPHALEQCRRLMKKVQKSQKSLLTQHPVASPSRPALPRIKASELEQHADFKKGAKQFNQALDQFDQYKAKPSRKELLKPTEDLAREAAQTFEALKRQAPAEMVEEIDRHIHKCYGIVSACRQQQLEAEGAKSTTPGTFNRGTARPSRRPVLPAYQPTQ